MTGGGELLPKSSDATTMQLGLLQLLQVPLGATKMGSGQARGSARHPGSGQSGHPDRGLEGVGAEGNQGLP